MSLNEILALLAALGGFETVKCTIRFFVNRKTDKRRELASVSSLELENQRDQVNWLEQRLTQRDAKIDALYVELRKEQSDKIQLMSEKHIVELEMAYSRCDVDDCGKRRPPRGVFKINKEEEK